MTPHWPRAFCGGRLVCPSRPAGCSASRQNGRACPEFRRIRRSELSPCRPELRHIATQVFAETCRAKRSVSSPETHMPNRTAKFVSAVFASVLAGIPLATASHSATPAADDCLSGPRTRRRKAAIGTIGSNAAPNAIAGISARKAKRSRRARRRVQRRPPSRSRRKPIRRSGVRSRMPAPNCLSRQRPMRRRAARPPRRSRRHPPRMRSPRRPAGPRCTGCQHTATDGRLALARPVKRDPVSQSGTGRSRCGRCRRATHCNGCAAAPRRARRRRTRPLKNHRAAPARFRCCRLS